MLPENEKDKEAYDKDALDSLKIIEMIKSNILNPETIINVAKTVPSLKEILKSIEIIAKDIKIIQKEVLRIEKDIQENTGNKKKLAEISKELEEIRNKLPESLKSIIPEKHVKPNNKLANEITRDFLNNGEMSLVVSRNGAKKEIITKAILAYDDKNVSLSGRATFTPYDREVHDAVVTLYVAGNTVVTPEMVYRAMTGKTETEKISSQAVEAVTESLDKSRRIMVNIDFSDEAKAYGKHCKAKYEGYLLASDKMTVSTGGVKKEAYKILTTPILYQYAQVSKQIISVPIRLLQTTDTLRNTDDVIVIKGYLLRQVEGMKSKTFKRSNKITFEGIYAELDVTPENFSDYKGKTKKIKAHVDMILTEWIEQGYIKSYTRYKEKNTIKGVEIEL